MPTPYNYVKQNNGVNCILQKETSLWNQYSVGFPSAQNLPSLGNIPVKGDYYFPRGRAQAPLAIIVHGMGDSSIIPCRLIARSLARKGIASFVPYLIFHKSRAPEIIKTKYPALSAGEWFESYQISVTDIRQIIDWAENRPEILKDNVSVTGISYGSFVSAIAMALDKRIRAGIFIVSGGNSTKLTKHSFLLRWQYKQSQAEYQNQLDLYARFLSQVAEKGLDATQDGLVLTRAGSNDRSLADGESEEILEIPASDLVNVEFGEIEISDSSKSRQIMNLLFYGKKDEDERRKMLRR